MIEIPTEELLEGIALMLRDVRGSTGNVEEKLDKVISLLESIEAEMPQARQLADLMPTLTNILTELQNK